MIGIIGAMEREVESLVTSLEGKASETVSGITFYTGRLESREVVIAKCGVGKVFAALTAEAMIIKYSPELIINTGVGGALAKDLKPLDVVIASRLCQHDMDTTPLGDPKGLISGICRVYFDADVRAGECLIEAAGKLGINARLGCIASGDKFVAEAEDKKNIVSEFSADVCEMEGGAIAHVAFVNNTPFTVIRAISDSADGEATMDYPTFLGIASKNSTHLTLALVEKW